MTDVPDARLLEQFIRNDSEEAFATLVQRHIALVHSVALRHTANPQHAEDITQAVFVILARKAGTLGRKTVLPGWLYHTARLTAANLQRAEARRVHREQEAFMQSRLEESPTDVLWLEMAPQLDEAMAGLGTSERDALVLRYFQNKSMAEVGEHLGLEENTAQKRVGRALEKLRKFFVKRGVDTTATGIADTISTHSVYAVPVALAKSVTVVALAKGAAASASSLTLVKGTLKIMTYAKLKLALGIGMTALLASGVVTVALSDGAPKPAAAEPGSTITKTDLHITGEFIEAPDDLLANLDVQWQPADSGGATAVLTQEQHSNLVRALKQNRNAKVLSQPRIGFAPPEPGKSVQGSLSMTESVKVSGTNAESGTFLNVTALLSPNSQSANLIIISELRELVDVSPQHDGSQNTIRTTKAATTVTTLTLNPSQTILIRQPIDDKGLNLGVNVGVSKSLVIFVTPQLSRVTQRLQQKIIRVNPTH